MNKWKAILRFGASLFLCMILLCPATLAYAESIDLGDSANDDVADVLSSSMPSWYPEDIENFEKFHDPYAKRVIDQADIFTEEEEQAMSTRIAEIIDSTQKDIVVYTDTSTYGMDISVCSADFYDFNGYGIGDNYDGLILMICMDPNDRGYWSTATGSVIDLYTEANANILDDTLYSYMVNGTYGEGVLEWIDHVGTLYEYGVPYVPEWYPKDASKFVPTKNENGPRVVDERGILSDKEKSTLEETIAQVSRDYKTDVVVYITDRYYNLSGGFLSDEQAREEYARQFFYYNGYGLSEKNQGVCLLLCAGDGWSTIDTYATENLAIKFSEKNVRRLEEMTNTSLSEGGYYSGITTWVDGCQTIMKKGKLPHSWFVRMMWALACVMIGGISGSASLGRARAGMQVAEVKHNANQYVKSGSFKIRSKADQYLRTTVNRIYSPLKREDDRGSGGGGGSSTFSSSFSGSSGTSHSGSGRKF